MGPEPRGKPTLGERLPLTARVLGAGLGACLVPAEGAAAQGGARRGRPDARPSWCVRSESQHTTQPKFRNRFVLGFCVLFFKRTVALSAKFTKYLRGKIGRNFQRGCHRPQTITQVASQDTLRGTERPDVTWEVASAALPTPPRCGSATGTLSGPHFPASVSERGSLWW